ncbi:cytochrome P450 [Kitasatospora sp. NPDC008050]|uniref:cytochrome P450 n=1 Tax=Kitasatospora sp. NPDC008050 TaxID=3364021 RepID=UPI0036EB34C0
MPDTTTTSESTSAAPAFPMPRTCPYALPQGYTELREKQTPLQRVTLFDGTEAWVVSGHAQARQLLADHRLSSDKLNPGFPAISPAEKAHRPFRTITELDPPEHDVHRRMLIPAFTARRIQEMRPLVQQIVDDRLDTIVGKGPTVDLVAEFAVHVPSMVICHLLDIPYEDHEFFQEMTRKITQERGTMTGEEIQQVLGRTWGYLDARITKLTSDPQDGLLSLLATERVATGTLEHHDLIAMALVLLVAAQETTSSTLGSGIVTLLEHPEQLARVQADPTLWGNAVEEVLRYTSVADMGTRRGAKEDIEIGGVVIRAGEGVIIPNLLVNRDPQVFADPDTFDVGRSARTHLAFGHGVHNCIGQNMSRLVLEVGFRTLFARLPGLRLAVPAEQLEMSPAGGVQTLTSLPATW